jgi:hypothetical protein
LLASGALELRKADALAFVAQIAQEISTRIAPGALVCFFNTVVTCYFDTAAYDRLHAHIFDAFRGPLAPYTCLWVEHEPDRPGDPRAPAEPRFESLVRVHRLSEAGQASTTELAGTEMHPRRFTLLAADNGSIVHQ